MVGGLLDVAVVDKREGLSNYRLHVGKKKKSDELYIEWVVGSVRWLRESGSQTSSAATRKQKKERTYDYGDGYWKATVV